MEKRSENAANSERAPRPASIIRRLADRIMSLFEPEEVEVTFKREGNKTIYTYTKVSHGR